MKAQITAINPETSNIIFLWYHLLTERERDQLFSKTCCCCHFFAFRQRTLSSRNQMEN